jgi:hypothetical protein
MKKQKVSRWKIIWWWTWRSFLGLLVFLVLVCILAWAVYKPNTHIVWGASFNDDYAKQLGLDPHTTFLAAISDLGLKNIRLNTYWEEIENTRGKFTFDNVDWYLKQAEQKNVKIVLVVGHKQPRWPECHNPDWFNSLTQDQKDEAIKEMLKTSVEHFKQFSSVEVWQVENEPYFKFGPDCPKSSSALLTDEVKIVKSLDSRPTLVTDSGEIGRWLPVSLVGADYFGSTMYRVVHTPTFGYFKYPLPPGFFETKAELLHWISNPKKIWGMELQAEPWFENGATQTPLSRHLELMNPSIFKANMDYARSVGFERNYLWGLEWWYWMKTTQNHPEMWEVAKELYTSN